MKMQNALVSASRMQCGQKGKQAVRQAARATLNPLSAPAAECLESRQMLSSTWFVSASASAGGTGAFAHPFQTIQGAADLAQAGDHVEIEAGTYRETVVPAASGTAAAPIVFEAYNGQKVTVSGANVVGGWTSRGNGVYEAPMPWDLGEGNNEVFVDGQMINEARFPNTSLDPSRPTFNSVDRVSGSGDVVTIYDSTLNQAADYWKGALIHLTAGQQWDAQTGTVLSSAPGQITVFYVPNNSYEVLESGDPYYLTGSLKALNSVGEWYRDPTSGALDLSTPSGDSPANHLIEAKARDYAFDLSGRANISIDNINIVSATIKTDARSTHTVINQLNASYISQFFTMQTGWVVPNNAGIMLNGADSLLENSTIAYSAGDGVYVSGAGSRVINNVIHDVDYAAGDAAGIRDVADNSQLDHNTIYNTGRDGILHEASGVQITYNDIHDFGLQTTDYGGIYTVRTNGGGSVIAYNTIHASHSGGYGSTAIYLDNYSSNFIVHHNRTWDVDTAIKLNFSSEHHTIYNNTFDSTLHAVWGNFGGDWNGTSFTNNVFFKTAQFGAGAQVVSNSTAVDAGDGAGSSFITGATLAAGSTSGGSSGGSSSGGTSSGGASGSTSGSGAGSSTGGGSTGATGGSTGSTSGSGSGSTGSTGGGASTGSTGGTSGSGSTTGGTSGSGSTSGGSTGGSSGSTGSNGGSTAGSGSTGSTGSGSTGSTTGTSGSGAGNGGSSTGSTGAGATGSTGSAGSGSTSGGTSSGTTSGASGSTGTGSTSGSSAGSSTGSTAGSSSSGNSTSTGSTATHGSGDTVGGTKGTGSTSSTGSGSTTSTGSGGTSAGTGSTESKSGGATSGPAAGSTADGSSTSTGGASSGTASASGAGSTPGDSSSSNGSESSSNTGDASGVGGSSASGDSGSPTSTPPVDSTTPTAWTFGPTTTQLRAVVDADRAALTTAMQTRQTRLDELSSNRRASLMSYTKAKRKLAAVSRQSPRVGGARGSAIAILKDQLSTMKLTAQGATTDLTSARNADFTGIGLARQSLATALHDYRTAMKLAA